MNTTDDPQQLREIIRLLERRLGIVQEGEISCCGISMAQCNALEVNFVNGLPITINTFLRC